MVINASALIAWFEQEPGHAKVHAALEKGGLAISSVNLTEVVGKLIGKGFAPATEVREDVLALGLEVVPFDESLALEASFFYARRNPYNLSLGDCACLATAERKKAAVLTAEKAWSKIPDLRVKINLIR
jgi:PIN domain nuclease of toxin-antitoxin system